MRITKEDFNKLNKKDQRELKQKIKDIKNKFSFNIVTYVWMDFIKYILYSFIIFLIVMPLWKLAYGDKVIITLATLFIQIVKILILGVSVGVALDVVLIYIILMRRIIKIKEVEKEYFKIEVKK